MDTDIDNRNQDHSKEIEALKRYILAAQESLEAAKDQLEKITGNSFSVLTKSDRLGAFDAKVVSGGKIIEGVFDGENMVGPENKIYPVPANYASKSKLVEGDRLKLTIAEDGTFLFKQIGPVPRKSIIGTLTFDNNAYHVLAEGKTYGILYASVTYYKAKPGDRVTIIVPRDGDSKWATLENVIHDFSEGSLFQDYLPEPSGTLKGNINNKKNSEISSVSINKDGEKNKTMNQLDLKEQNIPSDTKNTNNISSLSFSDAGESFDFSDTGSVINIQNNNYSSEPKVAKELDI